MRTTARLGALVTAIAIATVGWASAASAHAELESTDPADGSTVATAPAQVTLTFGEELVPETVALAVNGPNGTVAIDDPAVDGAVVTLPWPAAADAGEYAVAYRVVSQDGHPVEGTFAFTIEGGIVTTQGSAAASAAASPSGMAPPASATPMSDAQPTDTAYAPTGPEDGSVNWTMVIVVMAFGVAAFAALLIAGRRNPRRRW